MNADSQRTASWKPFGIPFQELIDKLIHLAFERRTETIRSKNQIALLASRWPPSVDSGYSVDMIVFPIHHRQWGFEVGATFRNSSRRRSTASPYRTRYRSDKD